MSTNPGIIGDAKNIQTISEAFKLFMSSDILNEIVVQSNKNCDNDFAKIGMITPE